MALSELTGHERVGVVNRNTKEKVHVHQRIVICSCSVVTTIIIIIFCSLFSVASQTVPHVEEPTAMAGRSPSLQRGSKLGRGRCGMGEQVGCGLVFSVNKLRCLLIERHQGWSSCIRLYVIN